MRIVEPVYAEDAFGEGEEEPYVAMPEPLGAEPPTHRADQGAEYAGANRAFWNVSLRGKQCVVTCLGEQQKEDNHSHGARLHQQPEERIVDLQWNPV